MTGEKEKNGSAFLPAIPMMDVYDLVDVADIINHLRKAVTDKWAYKIKFGDKEVEGLGITGVMESIAIIAKLSKGQHVIRSLHINSLKETAEAWEAEVTAGLYVVGIINDKPVELLLTTAIGFHRQPKLGVRRDGTTWVIHQPDTLAVSKAQRQGCEKLIPDIWKKKILQVARAEGKIKDETEETPNGTSTQKEATEAQIGAIKKRLKSEYVDSETRQYFELAIDKGMTLFEASRAIQTLSKIIEVGEAKVVEKKTGKKNESLL